MSRIEKIEVNVLSKPEDCTLLMNKSLSTPFNCAMHMSELTMQQSVVALLNGDTVWDMHRPLEKDCSLEFIHFKSLDPRHANLAFWRTGSFLLGYILENAFKEEFSVRLCSFPPPDISSGSFVYDVELDGKLKGWEPSQRELDSMSRIVSRLSYRDHVFERLTVSASVAKDMFSDNAIKLSQIDSISAKYNGNVTVYRMNGHVDISNGPLIATTKQLSHWFQISAIHSLNHSEKYNCSLHRIQGLAIPAQFGMHKWTFDYLVRRAAALNESTQNVAKI